MDLMSDFLPCLFVDDSISVLPSYSSNNYPTNLQFNSLYSDSEFNLELLSQYLLLSFICILEKSFFSSLQWREKIILNIPTDKPTDQSNDCLTNCLFAIFRTEDEIERIFHFPQSQLDSKLPSDIVRGKTRRRWETILSIKLKRIRFQITIYYFI